jgi:outer membrane protein assembly factor BamB
MSFEDEFSPEQVEKQLEKSLNLGSNEGKQLVQDLKQGYRSYLQQNERSLERVRLRLENQAAPSRKIRQIDSLTYDQIHRGRTPLMNQSPIASKGRTVRRTVNLLAAAAVIAILIGSTIFVLRHTKNPLNKPDSSQTSQKSLVTGSPQSVKDVKTSVGIYVETRVDDFYSQISRVDSKTRQPIWRYQIVSGGPYTVTNDTVYSLSYSNMPDASKQLLAINASNGKLRWQITLPSEIHKTTTTEIFNGKPLVQTEDLGYLSTPVESNGLVYLLSRSGKLYAINALNGHEVWMTQPDAGSPLIGGIIDDPAPVTVSNGMVYGGIFNQLFALNAKTGKLAWSTKIEDQQILQGIQIAGNQLYTSSSHLSAHSNAGNINTSYAFGFNAQTGQKKWEHNFPSWLLSSPTLSAENVLYVGTFDGNFFALKPESGDVIWQRNLGGRLDLSSAIVRDGTIYIEEDGNATAMQDSTTRPGIIALNSQGHLRWQIQGETTRTIIGLDNVVDGVVYVSTTPCLAIAYNAQTGSELWHQTFGKELLEKGTLYGPAPQLIVIP